MAVYIVRYLIGIFIISLIAAERENELDEPAEDIEPDIFSRIMHEQHKEPGPHAATRATNVKTKWIKQKLDHFNDKESRTWKMSCRSKRENPTRFWYRGSEACHLIVGNNPNGLSSSVDCPNETVGTLKRLGHLECTGSKRYMVNDEFFKENGPMFIHVGGEWAISPGAISGGHIYDMAQQLNAYLFYTEHRYYGKSMPVWNLSTNNLRFLSVRQSLADLAFFIRTMKSSITGLEQAKVILTGGSYSGAMVTWFKVLYPDLVVGCWASSAPLLAQVDFKGYKQVTGESICQIGGADCYNRIHNGTMEMERMLTTNNAMELKEMFNLCDSFDEKNELDVWSLFFTFSNIFAGFVQNHRNDTIQQTCQTINSGKNDVDGLHTVIMQFFSTMTCNDVSYKSLVKSMSYKNFGARIHRQWTYQTCNEFGWIQSSSSTQQPFGTKFPPQLYTTLCRDLFGSQLTEDYIESVVNNTNSVFGGLQPPVENVYFTHGQLDPWHAAGIVQDGKATLITGNSHCQDFGSISAGDSTELKNSKEKLLQLIKQWIK